MEVSAPRSGPRDVALSYPASRREKAFPSPTRWQDEVIYFLLPDRFSDGRERTRPLLDRGNLEAARPAPWSSGSWATSGYTRFQGGTLKGVTSRLPYLQNLGVTAVWLGPPWKQRAERDDYHGYAVQSFVDVDPRFGTTADLVDLVSRAHDLGMRVIFDVIINHTGENWLYQAQLDNPASDSPPYREHAAGPYHFGAWLDGGGNPIPSGDGLRHVDDGVWPAGPLQSPDAYHRAGAGNYSDGQTPESAFAEFRWSDRYNRDLALTGGPLGDSVLEALIESWIGWLEITDCDGFRIDTFKHIRIEEGRRFCSAVREYAESRGKDNFLLVAEVGGGDSLAESYLTINGRNLSAVLEIGEARQVVRAVAAGEVAPNAFFDMWPRPAPPVASATSEALPLDGRWEGLVPGSHRNLGDAFIYSLDDHDNLWLNQLRFATQHPGLTIPAVALIVLTLGIPCLYYGTEQALGLPADLVAELPYVNDGANGGDRYIREAMFGPEHPRRSGRDGLPTAADPFDSTLPGFGPFGTAGHHVFDETSSTFLLVASLLSVRSKELALRRGRQYLREVRVEPNDEFGLPEPGRLVAWSRILADTEVVCVVNLDANAAHGGDVTLDATLNESTSTLQPLLDTEASQSSSAPAVEPDGQRFPARTTPDGRRYVTVPRVSPAHVLVLRNDSQPR